jgi:hypothetical protein
MHSMPNTDLVRHDIGIREDHLIDTLVANDTGIKRYFLVMPVSLLETRLLHAIMAGVAFHRSTDIAGPLLITGQGYSPVSYSG